MQIGVAQLNPTVGDIDGNLLGCIEAIEAARAAGAGVVVLPELALIGYPPRDLLLRQGVVESCELAVRQIAERATDIAVIVGHPRRVESSSGRLRNSVSVCAAGEVVSIYDKRLLPGYDVFDEDRWFEPGEGPCVVELGGRRLGILVCEDLWQARDAETARRYPLAPVDETVAAGADVLVVLNASPFVRGKPARHLELLSDVARRAGMPLAASAQVGGNDELVFDGGSAIVGADGAVNAIVPPWGAGLAVVDLDDMGESVELPVADADEDVLQALVLGLRDYCWKTGHERALIGLSGGIDSALTAVVAGLALGPENVTGVLMPSRFSSDHSRADAVELATRLGLGATHEVPIESIHTATAAALRGALDGELEGLADENTQARIRGMILMALSNARGGLVLATGNKSELAVGYSTLYGDMCGAVSVLGDVLKTDVWALSRFVNEHHAAYDLPRPPIPERSIAKPPSAELRPDQTDQDSLPDYETLDQIIRRFVEQDQSAARIVEETNLPADLVERWTLAIDRAQYKREQAAVILKVSPRAFGRGRTMPIVMG